MKLYHGSKNGNLQSIRKNKARVGNGVVVPKDELLDAIYLTPSYEYALAMAARPDGITHIDENERTIEFENPESFNPEKEVYVYEIDVSGTEIRKIDELQYVIECVGEIKPVNRFVHRAGDIEQYYEIKNWKKESTREIGKIC